MTLSFRKYLSLEQLKKNLLQATESGDFPDKVFAYLSVACDSVNENETWENSVFSLAKAFNDFQPNGEIPLIKDAVGGNKPPAWDWEGRTWYYWSNVFAKAYGWSLEYTGSLDVNDALALAQEIFTDEQLEHEFIYSLSEIAYPYSKSTKKSYFKPMSRPYWMRPVYKEIKKIRIHRSLLPVGYGVDASGMPEEYGTKIYLNNDFKNTNENKEAEKAEETNPPPGA